jgi:hypothetical protein
MLWTRKSDVLSPTAVVRIFTIQKNIVISGTLLYRYFMLRRTIPKGADYNLFIRNSNTRYPMSPETTAMMKFVSEKMLRTAHQKLLPCPTPDWTNSPINKFE